MAECDARQAELKKKCKDLRKRVQTKEAEVQLTRSSIDRATKKQEEEKKNQDEKEQDIIKKRIEEERENKELEQLKKELDWKNKFKQYLDLVCEQNEGTFDEVDQITNRHGSLQKAKEDLEKLQRDSRDERERINTEKANETKKALTDQSIRNTRMSQMRLELENIRAKAKEYQENMVKSMDANNLRVSNLGNIHMAVDNLYNRIFMMEKDKMSKARLQESEQIKALVESEKIARMLGRISEVFLDMQFITKEAAKHPKKPDQVLTVSSATNKAKKKLPKEGGAEKTSREEDALLSDLFGGSENAVKTGVADIDEGAANTGVRRSSVLTAVENAQ